MKQFLIVSAYDSQKATEIIHAQKIVLYVAADLRHFAKDPNRILLKLTCRKDIHCELRSKLIINSYPYTNDIFIKDYLT